MKTIIQYKKSKYLKDLSKITILQDGLEIPLNKSYYRVGDRYYHSDNNKQIYTVAFNEPEFKEYIQDRVIERDRANR